MRYAVNVPNFGGYEDPATFADLARETEAADWDALFVWDHIVLWDGMALADPWVLLSAAGMATDRILLGTMVTPLPRRRPWVVARQAVTLDHLTNGRVVLGVGIGFPPDDEFGTFGEPTDARVRAEMLDESLEILGGMWSGEPFEFSGRHYRVELHTFLPRPVQQPRIPIWVAGTWPLGRPLRRAARFDGYAPLKIEGDQFLDFTVADVADITKRLADEGAGSCEISIAGGLPTDPDDAAALVRDMEEAGVTWWQVGPDPSGNEPVEDFRQRVRRGPPV